MTYTENDQRFIEEVIVETFKEIDRVYKNSTSNESDIEVSGCRLIFPKYSESNTSNPDKLRVSEQELRFTFVELFCKKCQYERANYHYSIETPTKEKYVFSERVDYGETPRLANEDDKNNNRGESARFDLTIYNSSKEKICLVEFKNNDSKADNYKKDFLKLFVEGQECLCYFIDLVEASDSSTLVKGIKPRIKSVDRKFFKGVTYIAHCIINRGQKGFDTIYDEDGQEPSIKNDWKKHNLFSQI